MLKRKGVKHVVLNAKYHAQEAEIVAQAGRAGTVTIATNMAGRGTDILLGGNPEFMARQQAAEQVAERLPKGQEKPLTTRSSSTSSTSRTSTGTRRDYERLSRPSRRRPTATTRRSSRLAVFTSSAPNAMSPPYRQPAARPRRASGRPGFVEVLPLEDDLMRIFMGSNRISGLMERLGMEEACPLKPAWSARRSSARRSRWKRRTSPPANISSSATT